MKKVYIIIVNWNSGNDTCECLASLSLLEYTPFTVVVCDNGSSDDSIAVIKESVDNCGVCYNEYSSLEDAKHNEVNANSHLIIINNPLNLGFAGGNNIGIRYALAQKDCSYVWLLNNDTVVEPDALTHLVERVEQQPSVGMCGSTIRFYHEPDKIQAMGGGYYCSWLGLPFHYGRFATRGKKINQRRAEIFMNYVEGASMLVTRQFIEEIGLMCEDYFLYFEEADWAIRAKGRFRLGYASQSVVYHKVGGSIGTSSNPAKQSGTSDYFNIRNRLLFTRRFYPVALPTVWLVVAGALVLRICMGRWDRAMMIFRLLCCGNDGPDAMLPEYRTDKS